MNRFVVVLLAIVVSVSNASIENRSSASDVVTDIYRSCLSQYSVSCVKPKALAWISEAVKQDVIKITDDLSIIKTSEDEPVDFSQQRSGSAAQIELFDKIDSFLSTHSLRIGVPAVLKTEEARAFIPETYLQGGLSNGLEVPLAEGNVAEGRSFVKKVMVPFLLGLKFKATVLVPLALALIALKTWKAMTLGLLSIVLAGAMVLFKFAKPKVVNYEVVHYPQHVEHHVDHPPHHVAPAGWEPPHGWARQMDAQDMAYSGYF